MRALHRLRAGVPVRALGAAAFFMAVTVGACGDDEVEFPGEGGGGSSITQDGFEPTNGGMRRLLAHEYTRSVELVLGADAAAAATAPVDIGQEGFDAIGAVLLGVSLEPVEFYERSSEYVAEAALLDPSTLADAAPCVLDGQADTACYEEVATEVGRLLWRRPLTEEEVTEIAGVASFAGSEWVDSNGFEDAIKYELMALLQSPSFLYVTELGVPDEASGYRRLDGYEMASRMSLFLLGRGPTGALLDQAAAGQLETDEEVRAAAQDMIDSGDAKVALDTFYDELFRLRNLADVSKKAELFPEWTPELAAAMRQETLLLINDIVWVNDSDARNLFNADYTFANGTLATHYGLSTSGGATFSKVKWPELQHRAGFTSQGSFLSYASSSLRNSPTKRGKFVLSFILCRTVPPPPPDVVPELPEDPPGNPTLQELLEQHMDNPSCNGCHGIMDPIGFAFEFFDAVGGYRLEDNGSPVSGVGSVEEIGEWKNAAELGEVLFNHEDTTPCMVKNFVRGKLGHTETTGELPAIDELTTTFADNGHSLQKLLVEMTANRLFRYVGEPR